MASTKEIKKHLNIALEEVGEIKPRFSKNFNAWTFSHKKYPDVEYVGESAEEVYVGADCRDEWQGIDGVYAGEHSECRRVADGALHVAAFAAGE